MNKKEKKEAVLLSDGTLAKVGKIVVVIDGIYGGNLPNTVTKITRLFNREGNEDMCCESIRGKEDYNTTISTKTPSWYEHVTDVRTATSEERKQYYANKFSNQ